MATHSAIFDATAACRRSLEACLDIPCLMENEWAENQLADFNLWSAGAGASAKERASLDQRLILEPDIRSIAVNLLRMLNGFIVRCKQNALIISKAKAANTTSQGLESRHGQTEDPSLKLSTIHYHNVSSMQGDTERSKYQLEVFEKVSQDRENVRKTLHQISRLTVAIRKSGSHSRLQKADSSFDPSDHGVLRKHLELIILAKPSKEGRQMLQLNADALSSIQSRLIEANLRRRNRFLYAQRHSKKLAEIRETHANNHSDSIDEHVPHSQKPDLIKPIKKASSQHDTKGHPDTLTATSASAVDIPIQIPKEESPQLSKEESSQLSKTILSSTGAKIVYPLPPAITSSQNIFKCPCCCQALPAYFSKGKKWRKHLMGDILPYTCIIDDCPNPWNFYLTREAWMKHMKEEHKGGQYWVCFACRNRNEFHEQSVFINHLQTEHQGISAKQISTFLSACSRYVPIGIRSCPICLQDAPDDTKSLLDHIAEHVHSFSLRSLPWAPSDDTADGSISQIGSDDEIYFLDNDYFRGDSAHASSDHTPSSGTDARDLEGLPELSFENDEESLRTQGAVASSVDSVPSSSSYPLSSLSMSDPFEKSSQWLYSGETEFLSWQGFGYEDTTESTVTSEAKSSWFEVDSWLPSFDSSSTQGQVSASKDEAPIMCHSCQQTFLHKSSLDRHRKETCGSGSETVRFQCNPDFHFGCKRSFKRRRGLKQHYKKLSLTDEQADAKIREQYGKGMHRRPI